MLTGSSNTSTISLLDGSRGTKSRSTGGIRSLRRMEGGRESDIVIGCSGLPDVSDVAALDMASRSGWRVFAKFKEAKLRRTLTSKANLSLSELRVPFTASC